MDIPDGRPQRASAPPVEPHVDGIGEPSVMPPPAPTAPAQEDPWLAMFDQIDLRGRMQREPQRTLLIAAGIGFVVSGALFSRFSLRLLGLGMRAAALPMLEARIQGALRTPARASDPSTTPHIPHGATS